MANPQLENGYMRIANEIVDALGKANLNGTEQKVVWCVLRYTYGFNRKNHKLSSGFIAHWSGCSARAVKKAVKSLRGANIIIVSNADERGVTAVLSFNKNYDTWKTGEQMDTAPVNDCTPVPVNDWTPKIRQSKKTNLKDKSNVEINSGMCLVKEVVDFLNSETGKNFRWQTKATQKLINARVAEGFTAEDFRRVIEYKTSEWKETDMEKYLRPETLFGTKFEGNLNSAPTIRQGESGSEEVEARIDLWED